MFAVGAARGISLPCHILPSLFTNSVEVKKSKLQITALPQIEENNECVIISL